MFDAQLSHRDLRNRYLVTNGPLYAAIDAMIQDPKHSLSVLEVHNTDYVNNLKRMVQRIC